LGRERVRQKRWKKKEGGKEIEKRRRWRNGGILSNGRGEERKRREGWRYGERRRREELE